jgi:hypothetical protein
MVQPSLADELGELMDRGDNIMPESLQFALGGQTRPLFILKCHSYLRGESYLIVAFDLREGGRKLGVAGENDADAGRGEVLTDKL